MKIGNNKIIAAVCRYNKEEVNRALSQHTGTPEQKEIAFHRLNNENHVRFLQPISKNVHEHYHNQNHCWKI